jgi:hypothetical protein
VYSSEIICGTVSGVACGARGQMIGLARVRKGATEWCESFEQD